MSPSYASQMPIRRLSGSPSEAFQTLGSAWEPPRPPLPPPPPPPPTPPPPLPPPPGEGREKGG
eukprot:7251507-Pyramimonas_sp.AAC.1